MRASSKALEIIETGSVELGREIEMLSRVGLLIVIRSAAKAIKEPPKKNKKESMEFWRIQKSRTQVNELGLANSSFKGRNKRKENDNHKYQLFIIFIKHGQKQNN